MSLAALADRAQALISGRTILGITGPPAAGKTTLSLALAEELSRRGVNTAVVGMDGFHLAGSILEARGLQGCKGAPETFDAAGFGALLERIATEDTVYAPAFHREIEESIAHEVEISPDIQLVITEGNYLLLGGPWERAKKQLAEVWYLSDGPHRMERLIARHINHGKTTDEATAWAHGSDEANARLIATTAHRADLILNEDLTLASSRHG
ncbi:MAG: nucleoside/nucleotide kinase family protein [Flaviflexus sp.]|nr:nucleoside/nucleotide kinase family protein [Flaviflexus sp.]